MKTFLTMIGLAALLAIPANAQNSPPGALVQRLLGSGVFRVSTSSTNPPAAYNPWRTIGPNGFTLGFVVGTTNVDCTTNIIVVCEFSDDAETVITLPSGSLNVGATFAPNGTNLCAWSTNWVGTGIIGARNYVRIKTIDNTNVVGTAGSVWLTNAYILSK